MKRPVRIKKVTERNAVRVLSYRYYERDLTVCLEAMRILLLKLVKKAKKR